MVLCKWLHCDLLPFPQVSEPGPFGPSCFVLERSDMLFTFYTQTEKYNTYGRIIHFHFFSYHICHMYNVQAGGDLFGVANLLEWICPGWKKTGGDFSVILVSSVNSARIKWLSERFYPDADGCGWTSFGKIRR